MQMSSHHVVSSRRIARPDSQRRGAPRHAAVLAVVALCLALPRGAAAQAPPTVSLFNGHDLQGWTLASGQVAVDQGVIAANRGARLVYTEFPERNMILRLKYQRRGTTDATPRIYYHSTFAPEAAHLAGRFVSLRATGRRRARRLRVTSAWNELELQIANGRGTITVNGRCVGTLRCADRDGYIALGAAGSPGAAVAFKDISVTELDHKPLFNGHDLAGWEGADAPAEQCWKVENGLLFCTGTKGPWLRSAQTVADFDLRLQYRLKPGGNSGVYIRVPAGGNHHGAGAGIEVQILDDAAPRYRKLKPYQFAGSLYAIVPASPRVSRPAGQWNSLEITCHGKHYTVRHNGQVVIDADGGENPELAARRTSGYLGLQNHSETVWFRDLRIETLPGN